MSTPLPCCSIHDDSGLVSRQLILVWHAALARKTALLGLSTLKQSSYALQSAKPYRVPDCSALACGQKRQILTEEGHVSHMNSQCQYAFAQGPLC
jgi:hypothetical protein